MRKKEKYYLVEFKVYQYNSGRADNGTFEVRLRYNTLEEAIKIKKWVDMIYDIEDPDLIPEDVREWYGELITDYTAIGGFIDSEAKVIAKYDVEIEVNII